MDWYLGLLFIFLIFQVPVLTQDVTNQPQMTDSESRRILASHLIKRSLEDPGGNPIPMIVPPDPREWSPRRKEPNPSSATNYGPYSEKLIKTDRPRAHQGQVPIIPSDAAYGSGDAFRDFDQFTDSRGLAHRPRSRSPWSKPGLWEPNPDDPHNRDHANKYWYQPTSVTADWLNGQVKDLRCYELHSCRRFREGDSLAWNGHWAVPAAGTGGSAGYSVAHFPSIGNFLNIPDDYD